MRGVEIFIGCAEWQKSHREYWATFPIIEIQQTFYDVPALRPAAKWRAEAPGDFLFGMKAW